MKAVYTFILTVLVATVVAGTATAQMPGEFPPDQAAFPGPYTDVPTVEGDWNMLANGRIFTLSVSRDAVGALLCTMSSGNVTACAYDSTKRLLTFTREIPPIGLVQNFKIYLLMQSVGTAPPPAIPEFYDRGAGAFTQTAPVLAPGTATSGVYMTKDKATAAGTAGQD